MNFNDKNDIYLVVMLIGGRIDCEVDWRANCYQLMFSYQKVAIVS